MSSLVFNMINNEEALTLTLKSTTVHQTSTVAFVSVESNDTFSSTQALRTLKEIKGNTLIMS